MLTKEIDSDITFDEFDSAINLAEIPEQTKWLPNKILIENQPSLIFPFTPTFKSAKSENIPLQLPKFTK